ncbi:hypothetical protein M8C21_032329 [Ambrosia artemisiifolia]|uniref:Uncharacterized protein n=1 Tax=Ambrosia artemisiifolia TaxID=4212 RepID=A0AAD5C953_AMBAR|nr:hypothetical protein M8C21_032325 [Ambrosia artemisiifolia]KAI7736898.1 hypothetical protein M8C21_032329 [Ambrosia artemisiifolia]
MTTQVETILEPWHDLTGKVVFVTGASSGIGKEFCLDLARAGCKIIASARRIELLKSLCDEINGMKSSLDGLESEKAVFKAFAVQMDVSADEATIEAAVEKAWGAFGHIDALINNAGLSGQPQNPLEFKEKDWEYIFRTNTTGSWLVAKHVGLRMRKAKRGGSVINISSITGIGRVYLPGGVAYASSKAAVNTMTKVMAMELGAYNIRVNCINPGIFRTEITQGLVDKDWFNNVTLKTIPLKTLGTINPALTGVTRYLIHDSSAYVTGSCFIADAGTSLVSLPIFSSL